jgi:hypothetical protein
MDQEQIDIVRIECRQCVIERASRIVGTVKTIVELAGDVDRGPVQTRGADALPDAAFVLIHLRCVDVSVADLQRGLDRIGGLVGGNLKHPETQLRNQRAIPQFDHRNVTHVVPPLLPSRNLRDFVVR